MKLKQKLNVSGNMVTEPRAVPDTLLNINELDLAQKQLFNWCKIKHSLKRLK